MDMGKEWRLFNQETQGKLRECTCDFQCYRHGRGVCFVHCLSININSIIAYKILGKSNYDFKEKCLAEVDLNKIFVLL